MPSLRDVLAAHGPLLLIDAASSRVQVGWLESGGDARSLTARWATSDDEAGVAVFAMIEQLGVDVNAAHAFVFCDGPGSVLGIRTVAMALRTWCVLKPRPVYAYCSLALVAHAAGRTDVGVIADARRESWHHYQIGRGLRRVPPTDLQGELAMPENFRAWAPVPNAVRRVPYVLAELWPGLAAEDLLMQADTPDAFLHEEPSYVTWTPQIHRAPGERPQGK